MDWLTTGEYLNQRMKYEDEVTLITINGHQTHGRIINYDQMGVILEVEGKNELFFMNGISAIYPKWSNILCLGGHFAHPFKFYINNLDFEYKMWYKFIYKTRR